MWISWTILQLGVSRSTTRDDRTIATRAERRCSPDFRVGYSRACHASLLHLHWLPVRCAVSCNQSSTGSCPDYLTNAVSPVDYGRPRRGLRSSSMSDFSLPRLRTKFGERVFTYDSPSAWSLLPKNLRTVTDPGLFRKRLKAHIFSLAFLCLLTRMTP